MVLYGLKHEESEYNHQFIVSKAKNTVTAIFLTKIVIFFCNKISFTVTK